MQLIALDFDGVIADSAPEAWLIALRTYGELRPLSAVGRMRDRADGQTPEQIRADLDYRRFVELMPLGNRAEDFGVAVSLVASGRPARDQAEFDAAYAQEESAFLQTFHERFYETRAALREGDVGRWVSLLGPYDEFVEIVRRRAGQVRLAIATAKDRDSVALLLRHYGIADLFPPEVRIDKEAGRSKRKHLAFLHERLSVPYREMVFVDDKVNHLDDVAGMGVECVLAAWGYNGVRERELARHKGHRVCTLEDFESQLFAAPPGA